MGKPIYKRVLLKISGEALAGDQHAGLNFEVIGQVCDVIKECLDMGVQVGLVVGGGNFWRGAKNSGGKMERTRADHMGMLATVMNCLAVADVCEQKGIPVRVQTAVEARSERRSPAITITGNSFSIREDADVDRVASALLQKIELAERRG